MLSQALLIIVGVFDGKGQRMFFGLTSFITITQKLLYRMIHWLLGNPPENISSLDVYYKHRGTGGF